MRRTGLHRGLAALLAAWFLLAGLSPMSFTPCPMDHMDMSANGTGMPQMAGAMGMPNASTHDAPAPSHGNKHSAPDQQNHRCTCPAFCAQWLASPRHTLHLAAVVPSLIAPLPPVGHAVVRAAFSLPFATAPPSGRLA